MYLWYLWKSIWQLASGGHRSHSRKSFSTHFQDYLLPHIRISQHHYGLMMRQSSLHQQRLSRVSLWNKVQSARRKATPLQIIFTVSPMVAISLFCSLAKTTIIGLSKHRKCNTKEQRRLYIENRTNNTVIMHT